MKRLLFVTFLSLVLGSTTLAGGPPRKDKQGKHAKKERVEESRRVSVDVHFSTREIAIIREYYAPRYRLLPRGLQKKLRRGGSLPPGWRKKLEPFSPLVERDLTLLPPGYSRGVLDGHAVLYNPRTQVVIDVAMLF